MKIVGVDPGLTGAMALYDTETQVLIIEPMPIYIRGVATKRGMVERRFFDMKASFELLAGFRNLVGATHYVAEKVGGIPGQSAPSAFNFGYGAGALDMAALALEYTVERVEPARWKSALRIPSDKRQARARASELFPGTNLWPLAKDDGKAEASLLCRYGELIFGPLRSV